MSEQSIAAARASVMIYDDLNKKWVPSGSSSGLSKVHIYQHVLNNTFRVVGRKLHNHEVVINCAILKGLKYNQATPTFHQWRDNKNVYGLNFSSKEDADAFALAMLRALEILSANQQRPPPAQAPPPPPGMMIAPQQQQMQQMQPQGQNLYGYVNGPNSDYEDLDYQRYRGPPGDEMGDRRLINQHVPPQSVNHSISGPPTPAAAPLPTVCTASSAGHHRTSSAPPAPTPPGSAPAPPPPPPPTPPAAPPAPPPMPAANMGMMPVASGPPPPPQPTGKAPPPPPPPPGPFMGGGYDNDVAGGSLANALANAKLRKTSLKAIENESPYGTTKGPPAERPQMGGMASMMDEMAKTLARRRAACENVGGTYVETDSKELTTPDGKRSWDKATTNGTNGKNGQSSNGGAESPKGRKRFGSTSGMEDIRGDGGGDAYELERMKAEILVEIRKEMQKMKLEIIDAIKVELNRR